MTTTDKQAKSELTSKQLRFVNEYLVDLNATQAAIRAGYSERTVVVQASRLLTNVNVQQAVALAILKRSERTEITQDRVLEELARVAFADIGEYVTWGPDGVKFVRIGISTAHCTNFLYQRGENKWYNGTQHRLLWSRR